jgi:integrase
LANTVVEIKQGVHCSAHRSPTVFEAGKQWLEQAAADGLERATIAQYRSHIEFHLKPFLGLHRLADLRPASVQAFSKKPVTQEILEVSQPFLT